MDAKTIRDLIKSSQQHDMKCVGCDELTRNRGVFMPFDQKEFYKGKVPEGKNRMVVYPICLACYHDKETYLKVEDEIRAQVASGELTVVKRVIGEIDGVGMILSENEIDTIGN